MSKKKPPPSCSRREFIKVGGLAVIGFSAFGIHGDGQNKEPLSTIIKKAQGLVIGDPTSCIGCLRCELACTEFNDGKASPSLSRIKISRNMNFGPKGVFGGRPVQGNWGNGLIIQDLCLQCPHPVPCANACPNDAIIVQPPLYARVVNPEKCEGCRMCLHSCPWDMMSFDQEVEKASKCFLCNGQPKCVEACPSGALRYISWIDLTDRVPLRTVPTAAVSPDLCLACHKDKKDTKR
jgi:Fe-S-cluster-containing dehydrogenase component